MITVIDVFRDMGLEPTKDQSWSVGAVIREQWLAEKGELPTKRLRRKTAGTGSHCIAVYPLSWKSRIQQAIKAAGAAKASQIDLLNEERA